MNTSFFIIIVFLSSLGFLYFFNLIKNILFCDSEDFKKYYSFEIVPISGDIENIEYLIRKHKFKNNKRNFHNTELIFLDINVNKDTKTILEKMKERYNFKICKKEEIYTTIKNTLKI